MFDTIIFDLDGTLLNTLTDLQLSTNFALKQFSYPERTLDEVRHFVGNGVAKLIERAIPDGLLNPDYKKCLDIFKEHYSQNMLANTKPYDGIIPLLSSLKQRGVKVGVVSNKFDSAVKNLCKRYFDGYVMSAAGETAGVSVKPSPDGVLKVMHELKSTAQTTIYAGDSSVDILTAHNANLKCIGVTWGFRELDELESAGADYIAHSPEEIIKFLDF